MLDHLVVGTFDDSAEVDFRSWLLADILPHEPTPVALEAEIGAWFAGRRVVRPGTYRIDRLIRSLWRTHDEAVLAVVADHLDPGMRERLDGLLTGRHGPRNHLLLLMMYRHGLRVSGAIGMRCEDVDLAVARLWVRRLKNGLSVELLRQPPEYAPGHTQHGRARYDADGDYRGEQINALSK